MKLIGTLKTVFIIVVLVLLIGTGIVVIRNLTDTPDTPIDNVEVEDIILNEENIIF